MEVVAKSSALCNSCTLLPFKTRGYLAVIFIP